MCELNEPVSQPAVETPLIAPAAAPGQRLEGGSKHSATLGIQHTADPEHSTLARAECQRASFAGRGLISCVCSRIDRMPVVVAEIAEATNGEVTRLVQERRLVKRHGVG